MCHQTDQIDQKKMTKFCLLSKFTGICPRWIFWRRPARTSDFFWQLSNANRSNSASLSPFFEFYHLYKNMVTILYMKLLGVDGDTYTLTWVSSRQLNTKDNSGIRVWKKFAKKNPGTSTEFSLPGRCVVCWMAKLCKKWAFFCPDFWYILTIFIM